MMVCNQSLQTFLAKPALKCPFFGSVAQLILIFALLAMTFCTHSEFNDFTDPPNFHLAPLSGQLCVSYLLH